MRKYVSHIWHDDWIRKHLNEYLSYQNAAEAYRKEFHVDISMPALKNHCLFQLGIKKPRGTNYRHITKEQADWLKRVYPKVGVAEAKKLWNDRYGDDLSLTCIKQIARRICNVTVDRETATANKLKAAHGKTSKRALRRTGETRIECGRLVMKDENGVWKSAGRCVWEKAHGKIPDGHVVLALDGNTENVRLDNLEVVPLKYMGMLQRNGFFSSDPEITKTGVIWCDLKEVLVNEKVTM